MKPWLDYRFGINEVHAGDDALRVNCSANQNIVIHKLYGPLAASEVRIRLEFNKDIADWVVEYLNPTTELWEEKARWYCQESWPESE